VSEAHAVAAERAEETPLALWRKLVEGRWRLVERFERDGRRYYVAYENPPGTTPPTALGPKERLLAALVGSGQSAKAVGYALGVGPSALSTLLKATLAKLGLRSRTDLVLFMHAVGLSQEDVIEAGDGRATRDAAPAPQPILVPSSTARR